jgi:hypothetical protein
MSDPTGDALKAGSTPSSTDDPASPHVHYALEVDTVTHQAPDGTDTVSFSPILRRRTTRLNTFKTVDLLDGFDGHRPGWQPGSEPGFDPTKPDGGHASMPMLTAPCEITVVDFSQDNMAIHQFQNESFIQFLAEPQEKWVKCRWININGLSWDVIQAVGAQKKLHKLAIEDIMNTRNRTKADW